MRQVRALRLTMVVPEVLAESTVHVALARVKLVGAPWVKRASTPIVGLSGERGEPHGEVIASVVTTENQADLGYEPPPGVIDEGVGYREVLESLRRQQPAIVVEIGLFDIYRGTGVEEGKKSLAFRVLLQDTRKTLTDAEVESAVSQLRQVLQQRFNAKLR